MDPARVESGCYVYVGTLFTATAVLLAWTQSDLSWLAIFGTGPIFAGLGLYRLQLAPRRWNAPEEFGSRVYSLLALAAFSTLIVAFQLFAHFG